MKQDDFSGYTKQTQETIRALVEEWALDDSEGLALLHQAAQCLDRMAECRDAIARDGLMLEHGTGSPKTHPAAAVERDARTQYLKCLSALNLDDGHEKPKMGRPARVGH